MMWFRRKKYLLVQMFLHHFLGFSIFKIFHTWSSYLDSKITIYNTLCWYSGKDTGLSPGRPQFKSRHHQGFLQKDLPWKFFKKWLSIRRITVWITSRSGLFPCPGWETSHSSWQIAAQTTRKPKSVKKFQYLLSLMLARFVLWANSRYIFVFAFHFLSALTTNSNGWSFWF